MCKPMNLQWLDNNHMKKEPEPPYCIPHLCTTCYLQCENMRDDITACTAFVPRRTNFRKDKVDEHSFIELNGIINLPILMDFHMDRVAYYHYNKKCYTAKTSFFEVHMHLALMLYRKEYVQYCIMVRDALSGERNELNQLIIEFCKVHGYKIHMK